MKNRTILIGKITAISTLSIAMLFGTVANALLLPSDTNGFTDTQNHWGKAAITALSEHCKIKGYLNNEGAPLNIFKPDASITRAELSQMLIQCSYPEGVTQNGNTYFSDVDSHQWYSAAVNKAKELGWVSGYKDGTYQPNKNVNRAEAVKMITLTKFTETQISDSSTSNFSDVSSGAWYYKYISFAVEGKFISGYKNSKGQPTGYFGPDKNITRAEAAKVIALVNGWITPEQANTAPMPTPTPTPEGFLGGASSTNPPKVGSCQIFPSDNPWNQDISTAQLHPDSDKFISYIQGLEGNQNIHPDFGGNGEYGIPYAVVGEGQSSVPVNFTSWPEQSDPGPYPIPPTAEIEGGSDAHVIVIDKDACKLYELYQASIESNGWNAASGAIFDLTSNALRPEGWTSADAAGLPIFAGLARYDEVNAGTMNHAIRVTFSDTQMGYIYPATHHASENTDAYAPPMGLRLRLKADFDTSDYTGQAKIILETMKKYGLMVADNGSNWFITGDRNLGWNDEELNQLKDVPGSAFEVVNTGTITNG